MNTALRLGKLCGDGPDTWLRMQMAYDKAQPMRELAPIIEKIPTLHAA